jgi:hypothetical protein
MLAAKDSLLRRWKQEAQLVSTTGSLAAPYTCFAMICSVMRTHSVHSGRVHASVRAGSKVPCLSTHNCLFMLYLLFMLRADCQQAGGGAAAAPG